jgi:hypothetical protein
LAEYYRIKHGSIGPLCNWMDRHWENRNSCAGRHRLWRRRYVGGAGTGVSTASFSRRPAPESRSDRRLGADVLSAHGQKTFQHMEMLISAAMI